MKVWEKKRRGGDSLENRGSLNFLRAEETTKPQTSPIEGRGNLAKGIRMAEQGDGKQEKDKTRGKRRKKTDVSLPSWKR